MKLPLYFSQQAGPRPMDIQYSHAAPAAMLRVAARVEQAGDVGQWVTSKIAGPIIEQQNRERELDLLNSASLMDNDFALRAHDILNEERANWKDRDTYRENVDKRLAETIGELTARYPRQVQQMAQRQINDRLTSMHVEDEDWAQARWLQQKQGEIQTILDGKKRDILEADRKGDTLDMARHIGEAKALFEAQVGVSIPADKGPSIWEKWSTGMDEERAYEDAVAGKLGPRDNYPNLDAAKYQSVKQNGEADRRRQIEFEHTQEVWNRQEEEREKQKAVDQVNMDYSRRLLQDNLTPADIWENTILGPREKEFWINRIEERTKKYAEEGEGESDFGRVLSYIVQIQQGVRDRGKLQNAILADSAIKDKDKIPLITKLWGEIDRETNDALSDSYKHIQGQVNPRAGNLMLAPSPEDEKRQYEANMELDAWVKQQKAQGKKPTPTDIKNQAAIIAESNKATFAGRMEDLTKRAREMKVPPKTQVPTAREVPANWYKGKRDKMPMRQKGESLEQYIQRTGQK